MKRRATCVILLKPGVAVREDATADEKVKRSKIIEQRRWIKVLRAWLPVSTGDSITHPAIHGRVRKSGRLVTCMLWRK